jgi:hypothetical protein
MNIQSILSKDISTWDDLMQKFTFLSKKEKGDAFENITKLYFMIISGCSLNYLQKNLKF